MADINLTAQERETLAEQYAAYWWSQETGETETWDELDAEERENVIENSYAEAVIDWLAARIADAERRGGARALRDAADDLPRRTEGTDRAGTATWREHDRDVYSLAIEEAQGALRERADLIEGGA